MCVDLSSCSVDIVGGKYELWFGGELLLRTVCSDSNSTPKLIDVIHSPCANHEGTTGSWEEPVESGHRYDVTFGYSAPRSEYKKV